MNAKRDFNLNKVKLGVATGRHTDRPVMLSEFGEILSEYSTNTAIIDVAYSDLLTLKNAGELVPSAYYNITDKADAGIIIQATSENTLSLQAKGLFLNCDYQDAGDYSGLPSPKGDNYKVWTLALQAGNPYVNNDIVFWNGIMYQVIDDTLFDANPPQINTNAYLPLSKSITNGYILESDDIIYNFNSDTFLERLDKRGNHIFENSSILYSFQWGNDQCTKCYGRNLQFVNSRIFITDVENKGTKQVLVSNLCTGFIQNAIFELIKTDISIELANGGFIRDAIIRGVNAFAPGTITLNSNYELTGEMNSVNSTFTGILDMDNLSIFSAGVLTIPENNEIIGEFTLKGNTGQTITKIVHLSTLHKVTRFYVESGKTQIFSHTAIASAVADSLVSDAATSNTIVGRANGTDFIEYEKSGLGNIRTNIVKLA